MTELFIMYLQASLWGAVMILAVGLLRCCLGRMPRWILCLLWLLVGVRLLLPFQLQSPVSLQPDTSALTEVLIQDVAADVQQPQSDPGEEIPTAPERSLSQTEILCALWLAVGGAVVLYASGTYWSLRYKLRDTVQLKPGIREGSMVPGAFVLGYFRPVIYLSSNMEERERAFVLAHERAHIARLDHWWKLLGYLCCCVHWFNPLVWVGYVLACRDIEYACDEKAVKHMDLELRKEYTLSLLHCGKGSGRLSAYPVPFVEGGLKRRVRKVLSMRKAASWLYAVGGITVVLTAALFLTTPSVDAQAFPVPQFQPGQTEPTQTTLPGDTAPADTQPEETETAPEETVLKETKPKATKPKETEPEETEPKETEPVGPIKPTVKPTTLVNGWMPDAVKNGDRAPAANTPTHAHTYQASATAPDCSDAGYTANTCGCGHVYYSNLKSATGHQWKFRYTREVSADYDGGDFYECSACSEFKWDNIVPSPYRSYNLKSVDKKATSYAAGLGFQTLEEHANRDVKCFSLCESKSIVELNGGEDYLLRRAKEFVKEAKAYCQQEGCSVSDSVIWVEVVCNEYLIVRVYCAV